MTSSSKKGRTPLVSARRANLTRVSYVKGAGRAREALDIARDAIPFPCRDPEQCERQGCQSGNWACAFFRPPGGDLIS